MVTIEWESKIAIETLNLFHLRLRTSGKREREKEREREREREKERELKKKKNARLQGGAFWRWFGVSAAFETSS